MFSITIQYYMQDTKYIVCDYPHLVVQSTDMAHVRTLTITSNQGD